MTENKISKQVLLKIKTKDKNLLNSNLKKEKIPN